MKSSPIPGTLHLRTSNFSFLIILFLCLCLASDLLPPLIAPVYLPYHCRRGRPAAWWSSSWPAPPPNQNSYIHNVPVPFLPLPGNIPPTFVTVNTIQDVGSGCGYSFMYILRLSSGVSIQAVATARRGTPRQYCEPRRTVLVVANLKTMAGPTVTLQD